MQASNTKEHQTLINRAIDLTTHNISFTTYIIYPIDEYVYLAKRVPTVLIAYYTHVYDICSTHFSGIIHMYALCHTGCRPAP